MLVPIAAMAAAPAASADPVAGPVVQTSQTFHYNGSIQTWVIPAGVTQLTVTSDGASGSGGGNGLTDKGGGGGGGIQTSSTVNVSPGSDFAPGDKLYIYAGGAGGHSQLTAFPGGGGGARSCTTGLVVVCGGDGGQGGGGSGVADSNSGKWVNIAAGGGGGGGGDDALIEFTNGGGGGGGVNDAVNGSSCTPPTSLASPGNAGAGAAGDNAQSGSGTGGGGGGGGGCPGGPGGKSGSEINNAASVPGAGGSEGDYYYGPDGVGFNGVPVDAPGGDGSVTISYTYQAASLTTTPSPTPAAIGSTLTDSATIAGLSNLPGLSPTFGHPTGNLEFKLIDPAANKVLDDETVAVDANGTYSTPVGYAPTATGSYQWVVSYNSTDGFNESINYEAPEPVTVTAAQPAVTVTPASTSVQLGDSSTTLTATAKLTGGYNPAGSITFSLFDLSGSTPSVPIDTEGPVAVSGNGSYSTPTGYTLPASGTVTGDYQWEADYTPSDSNNLPASSTSADISVTPANPSLGTTPNVTTTSFGAVSTLKDTANLSGAYNPGGSITFTLYYNGGPIAVDTETISVTGNGAYKTPSGYTLPTASPAVGSYQWDATYNGDTNNNGATDNNDTAEQTTVNPALAFTTTSVSASDPTVTYGSESAETLTGTVSGPSGDGTPQGTVNVLIGGQTLCSAVSLTAGAPDTATYSCQLSDFNLAAGHAQVQVTYVPDPVSSSNPNYIYTGSGATGAFTVSRAQEGTTTSLNVSAPAVTYGSEGSEQFTGTVAGLTAFGIPQGIVTVMSGNTTLCSSPLAADPPGNATYECQLAPAQLHAGGYPNVQAVYHPAAASSSDPSVIYTDSNSTPSGFTVSPAEESTKTTLNVSAPAVTYGSEAGETLSGLVTGVAGDGQPQGSVTVQTGANIVCTSALTPVGPASASYSCGLTAAQLDAGSYPLQASYASAGLSSNPDYVYDGSSATGSLTVNPAVEPTNTTLNVSAPAVTYGSETGETLSGLVSGIAGDGQPQGSVTIQTGANTICTSALTPVGPASASYSCTLTAAQLHAGSYPSVQATFGPAATSSSNPDYAYTGSSGTAGFTVNKATPVISWPNPANIVFGTLLSPAQLDATGSVAGTFAYSPAAGTLLPVGTGQVLHTTFSPADSIDYTMATATASINVTSQTCVSSGTSVGGLTIGTGKAGCVTGTGTVNGAVTVTAGGALYMNGGTVKGNLTISGATAVWLCNVTITGGITITGSTGPVLVGGPGCKNSIASSVSITGNKGGVTYLGNAVKGGSLTITGNSGGFNYIAADNTTTGKVTVSGNS